MLLTATWTLSNHGNTLNDDFTSFDQHGSPSNVKYVYERRSPGSGFAGRWLSAPTPVKSDVMLQVSAYDGGGLSFVVPQGMKLHLRFDGKPYRDATGSSSSARRVGPRTVNVVRTANGIVTQRRQLALSPDLKTLTMKVENVGKGDPSTYVFQRQRHTGFTAARKAS